MVNDFLNVASIPEDWGGDGRGRLNLSGRKTAISPEFQPRQYQFFDSNIVPEVDGWRIAAMPETVPPAKRRLLTWNNTGASTSRIAFPPDYQAPAGIFTADLEMFVLSGAIQMGEWQLHKHGYSFIPAGVKVGPWQVLGGEPVEILWMENGPGTLKYQQAESDIPGARMSEFIPALDSKVLPWGKTETVQFEVAKKKYFRKHSNGGGTWLIAVLPHYDGKHAMIQSYNEEAYGLAGYCDIGEDHIVKDFFTYVPSFTTVGRHITDDGCLFFVRVDRDLSQTGTVLSYPYE